MPEKPTCSRRNFLGRAGSVGLGLGTAIAAGPLPVARVAAAPIKPQPEITVAGRRQLLFDDFLLGRGHPQHESYPYNIRWGVGRVEKSPNENLLLADKPWEDTYAWTCVLYDEGRYRLWYHLAKNVKRSPGAVPEGSCVGYAESDDGLHWRKPLLKLVDRYGFKENNIVFTGGPDSWSMELGNVFKDPSAPPEERYKMLYPTWESKHIYGVVEGLPYVGEAGVLRGAHSPDGIHWQRYQHIFLGRYTDSQNVATYDPVLGKYVAYVRTIAHHGGLALGDHPVKPTRRGRAVARIESDDYRHWSYPEPALTPDIQDGLNVDFYNPGYSRYEGAENAHFLFPSALHHRDGTAPVQVAVSRDNRTWSRPCRDTFIPIGESGSFDDHSIYASPGFVPAGKDHLALYYRAANSPHGGAVDRLKPQDGRVPRTSLGRALFKRDRILGIEAGSDEGTFWTRPLLFEGRRLVVNVEPIGPNPELRVQLLGVGIDPTNRARYRSQDAAPPGYAFDDSLPVTTDELDGVVRWKHGAELGDWAGKPVRLHFRLRSMRLYAFQFVT